MKKSEHVNCAIFDPATHTLVVWANKDDVTVIEHENGATVYGFAALRDGIEIVHDSDRLWWPAEEKA